MWPGNKSRDMGTMGTQHRRNNLCEILGYTRVWGKCRDGNDHRTEAYWPVSGGAASGHRRRGHNRVTVASEISFRIPSNIYLVNNHPSAWCALPLIDSTKSQLIPASLSPPCPPGSASKYPLKSDLETIGNAPLTADQIPMILDYLPPVRDVDYPHHAALIFSHPSRVGPVLTA
jgi:hypothetical protein